MMLHPKGFWTKWCCEKLHWHQYWSNVVCIHLSMPLLTNGEGFRVKKIIAEIDENIMREKVKEEEIRIWRKIYFLGPFILHYFISKH